LPLYLTSTRSSPISFYTASTSHSICARSAFANVLSFFVIIIIIVIYRRGYGRGHFISHILDCIYKKWAVFTYKQKKQQQLRQKTHENVNGAARVSLHSKFDCRTSKKLTQINHRLHVELCRMRNKYQSNVAIFLHIKEWTIWLFLLILLVICYRVVMRVSECVRAVTRRRCGISDWSDRDCRATERSLTDRRPSIQILVCI